MQEQDVVQMVKKQTKVKVTDSFTTTRPPVTELCSLLSTPSPLSGAEKARRIKANAERLQFTH
jgi:hypothetical protein